MSSFLEIKDKIPIFVWNSITMARYIVCVVKNMLQWVSQLKDEHFGTYL